MKKLLLNRKPVSGAWGGGNLFVHAICDYAHKFGWQVVHSLSSNIDAILMIDPRYDELGISINEIAKYKAHFPNTRIIHRVNECDARKNTTNMDPMLKACSEISNATVFVSNWMRDYFKNEWKTKEQHVVYNGVEHEHFSPPQEDLEYSRKKFKRALNVPTRIVAHHWSNNVLKGFDIYEKLDEWVGKNTEYEFIYIGRQRETFKNTTVIEPLFGKALGEKMVEGDVYISASRQDPGPNHIIESLACGLPTFVHRDGGGAVEFAGMDAVYGSFEEFILRLTQNEWPKVKNWTLTWEECAELYFEIIEGKAPLFCGKISA